MAILPRHQGVRFNTIAVLPSSLHTIKLESRLGRLNMISGNAKFMLLLLQWTEGVVLELN